MAKAIAIRLNPHLRKHIHASQSDCIWGISLYNNILAMQLGIDYAKLYRQEMVMLQLDFAKPFHGGANV